MFLEFVSPQAVMSQDEAPAPDEIEKKVVLMAAPGQQVQVEPIIESVGAQLADLPVLFEVKWNEEPDDQNHQQEATAKKVSSETGARVVFWCDLTVTRRVYFYVDMPDGGIVLVRRLEDSPSSIMAETLAVIVRSLIKSILRGEEIEIFVEEPSEPVKEKLAEKEEAKEEKKVKENEKEPKPKDSSAPPLREKILSGEASYAVEVQSSKSIAQGIALGIDLRITRLWNIFARYELFIPVDKTENLEGFKLDIQRHPVWIGARLGRNLGKIVNLSGGLALRFDFLTMDIKESPPDYNMDDDPSIEFSVVPVMRMGVRIAGPAQLLLTVGMDIPIYYVKYRVPTTQSETDDEAEEIYVIDNWSVRPFGLLGVSVDLF